MIISFLTNFLIFIFGLIVGSFLNCVACRFKTKKSFITGRSSCPKCKHRLDWYDLVPLLSWIFLGAKCRYCNKKISWQYPLAEIATGLIFLMVFNADHITKTIYLLVISCFLIIIFIYDLRNYLIPDKIVLPAIVIAFLYNLFALIIGDFTWHVFLYRIYAGLLPSLFFAALFFASKGKWIGFGDVKLALLMGLMLGPEKTALAFYLAFTIGGIIGIGLILTKKKSLKSEIPFGPILILGTFLSLFFSSQIINWYLNLLL